MEAFIGGDHTYTKILRHATTYDYYPSMTTTPSSSSHSNSSNPFTIDMIKKILFNFTYNKYVYIYIE